MICVCVSLGCEKHPFYSLKSVLKSSNHNPLRISSFLKLPLKVRNKLDFLRYPRYSEVCLCLGMVLTEFLSSVNFFFLIYILHPFFTLQSPPFGNFWTNLSRTIQYDLPKRKTQNTLNFKTKKKSVL